MPRFHHFAVCALALALSAPPVIAQPVLEAPITEQGARFLPVLAANGMVASQEHRATDVGVAILKRGGNAVDAAVAVGLALAVTLPRAGNLGGGGFMLIHLASGKTTAIDYRETAPRATTADVFLDKTGAAVPALSRDGGLAIGVPGTVAGLALALKTYGSGRFSFAELCAPAIALARDGIPVDDDLADTLPAGAKRLGRWPSSAAIFLHPDGSPLHRGETLRQPDLATTLTSLAANGPQSFYAGAIADKIVASVRGAGGRMTAEDLAHYQAVERMPVHGTYRGHEIFSMPPPSSGGVHVIQLLNILEGLKLARAPDAATFHLMAEAMKLAYADRIAYLGDPDHVNVPTAGLVSKRYAAKLRSLIMPDRARPAADISAVDPLPYESDQTTQFSIVDAAGNAVSNTYTLNFSYGVGLVAAGAGFILNNELDDFAARTDAPNAYGLTGGTANAPGPDRRPLSSMAPTIVLRDGKVELVTGSPGGSRIITIVLNVLVNFFDFGLNIAEATDAPRIHDQLLPDELSVERGFPADTIKLLQAMGHKVVIADAWGSAQSIARVGDHWEGASDPRQRGTGAAGY